MADIAIVSNRTLGSNCWLSQRFIAGKRCARVMTCNYPEKQGCKAVQAEIAHLEMVKEMDTIRYLEKIQALNEMADGAIRRLKGEQSE